ncbi:hypothetical protein [Cupriavidus oxalaticus]|uniref:Uncharacterized protein n=1 Tax=Cupriavidus oxalaticus TaxID=96344 RepID=A0A976BFL3_9BURK|nr:hypothetical protein [Cupriavidus oxalaticus]QRQ86264.1 hypothetical protein JTE91_23945 [Cupriavidus oxalaticus]QRQ95409.1 hypothetical protein JTE92_18315 [Cupriavidus oxalaticus]WQD84066.1 hypothetical protein U0036_06025 [Cupriavidus oxalaticus]SPC17379.1 hypothetical protein CO2235_90253 [Cupriavidus oxalaticus]
MMDRTKANGVLEDVSAEIGYTATSLLVAWFGGANLYVPAAADENHPVSRLIGLPAFRRLVAAYGSETLAIPEGHLEEIDRRNRLIAQLIAKGKGSKEIAQITGLTERRVQQLRTKIERMDLIPLIMRRAQKKALEGNPAQMPLDLGCLA